MPRTPAIRWSVPVSRKTDRAVRAHLQGRGLGPDAFAPFVEKAVKWRVLDESLAQARAAFADLLPAELDRLMKDAVAAALQDPDAQPLPCQPQPHHPPLPPSS